MPTLDCPLPDATPYPAFERARAELRALSGLAQERLDAAPLLSTDQIVLRAMLCLLAALATLFAGDLGDPGALLAADQCPTHPFGAAPASGARSRSGPRPWVARSSAASGHSAGLSAAWSAYGRPWRAGPARWLPPWPPRRPDD